MGLICCQHKCLINTSVSSTQRSSSTFIISSSLLRSLPIHLVYTFITLYYVIRELWLTYVLCQYFVLLYLLCVTFWGLSSFVWVPHHHLMPKKEKKNCILHGLAEGIMGKMGPVAHVNNNNQNLLYHHQLPCQQTRCGTGRLMLNFSKCTKISW